MLFFFVLPPLPPPPRSPVKLSDTPTFVVPVSGRPAHFLVGLGRRICLLRWDGSDRADFRLEDVCTADTDRPNNRLNDGKVDRCGRDGILWMQKI